MNVKRLFGVGGWRGGVAGGGGGGVEAGNGGRGGGVLCDSAGSH